MFRPYEHSPYGGGKVTGAGTEEQGPHFDPSGADGARKCNVQGLGEGVSKEALTNALLETVRLVLEAQEMEDHHDYTGRQVAAHHFPLIDRPARSTLQAAIQPWGSREVYARPSARRRS